MKLDSKCDRKLSYSGEPCFQLLFCRWYEYFSEKHTRLSSNGETTQTDLLSEKMFKNAISIVDAENPYCKQMVCVFTAMQNFAANLNM